MLQKHGPVVKINFRNLVKFNNKKIAIKDIPYSDELLVVRPSGTNVIVQQFSDMTKN